MRQQLVQEFIPIEKICPQWVMHLAKMKNLRRLYTSAKKSEFIGTDEKFYDIADAKMCIVGEAHGSGDYNCGTCEEFSYSKFLTIHSFGRMNETLNEFAVHWNQEHL